MATLATNTRPVALGTVAESRPSPRVTGKRECAKTSQRESWTKTALGHAQVRREGRVSCASRLRTWSECDGGSNNDCCRCFKRARSQRSESKGGADAPQMGVFSHAETIHQVMSLIINTTGVGENRRGGRRKNMKEHAVSIRRSERAQPTAGRRIVKKNGNERTQQQEQSGQETKTAKVSLSGEVASHGRVGVCRTRRPGSPDRCNGRSEDWQRDQRTTREAARCRARRRSTRLLARCSTTTLAARCTTSSMRGTRILYNTRKKYKFINNSVSE